MNILFYLFVVLYALLVSVPLRSKTLVSMCFGIGVARRRAMGEERKLGSDGYGRIQAVSCDPQPTSHFPVLAGTTISAIFAVFECCNERLENLA